MFSSIRDDWLLMSVVRAVMALLPCIGSIYGHLLFVTPVGVGWVVLHLAAKRASRVFEDLH